MTPLDQPGKPTAGRFTDANLHLLDRQVLDRDGDPVTTVDDLELSDPVFGDHPDQRPSPPDLTALLTGPVLGTRIFGGRPPHSRLATISWSHVTRIGTTLRLDLDADDLELTWTERWVAITSSPTSPGGAIILSDLLGRPVLADQRVGYVTDVRFLVHDGPDGRPGDTEAYGVIVSPPRQVVPPGL